MADTTHVHNLVTLMNRGDQRGALEYLYANLNGEQLTEISQLGSRLSALAESASSRRSREGERKRRGMGGSDEQTFFKV